MSEKKLVTKKLVTVRCHAPFRIGHIPFAGVCNRVTLSVEDIAKCIEHKALVVEILSNGQEVPLGFDNYNTYNGPTLIDDDSPVTEFAEPVIERIENGKVTMINTVKKKEEPKKVVQIDLEAINKKKEEEKAAAEKAQKAKEAEEAKKDKEEKQREEQKKHDEEERKRAMDAVLAREKEASERKNADSGVVEISIKKTEDVVADKQETVAEIPGTLEVAAEESITMVVPGVAGDAVDVNAPDVVKEDNNQQQNNNKKDKKNKHH